MSDGYASWFAEREAEMESLMDEIRFCDITDGDFDILLAALVRVFMRITRRRQAPTTPRLHLVDVPRVIS